MWVIRLVVAAVVAGAFLLLRVVGRGRFPWVQFYAKGKESGFSLHEIHLLRRIAVETKLDNPTCLFWSIKQLDRSIKEIIVKLRAKDLLDNEDSNHLLGKLFELRKKVEFDLPKYRLGLKSTREIQPRHYSVKEAVFPFNMYPEVDPVLGPEMRSTGEVLGMADSFGLAFFNRLNPGEKFHMTLGYIAGANFHTPQNPQGDVSGNNLIDETKFNFANLQ